MSWLVFDCPSGMSGDMTLGALVDLGVPLDHLRQGLATLPLEGYALREERVSRNSIAALRVHVEIAPPSPDARPRHRHLHDVVEILQGGRLPERATQWAVEVFRRLALAEAEVHGVSVGQVHFHEVGAVDAIVDIAGACLGIDFLCREKGVDEIRMSQLRVGRGRIETEHGVMPIPPPAVLKLLEGLPVQWSDTDGERMTPTGAALLAALARPLAGRAVRVQATGYGAGAHEYPDVPNVLRLLLCEPETGPTAVIKPNTDSKLLRGQVGVIHTTIDDMVPEFYGHLMARLFAAGALDVVYAPVYMKKERPATLVTVIGEPEDAERLAEVLLNESSTLGVRIAYEERLELRRRQTEVATPYGTIVVKIAERPDGGLRVVPEYESVRRAAEKANVPLADVYQAALRSDPENP